MKKMLLSLLCFTQFSVFAQDILSNNRSHTNVKIDTIATIMLVTECNQCSAIQMNGFIVYEISEISAGFITGGQYNNSDYTNRKIIKYLDNQKKEKPKNVIVWIAKNVYSN